MGILTHGASRCDDIQLERSKSPCNPFLCVPQLLTDKFDKTGVSNKGCGARDRSKHGATSEALLVMSAGMTVDGINFQFLTCFTVRCDFFFRISAAALEAAKHETGPSNYKRLWDLCKAKFGKECDGDCEESVRFWNFVRVDRRGLFRYRCSESHVSVGSLRFRLSYEPKLRLCAQASSCGFVSGLPRPAHTRVMMILGDRTTRNVVTPVKGHTTRSLEELKP